MTSCYSLILDRAEASPGKSLGLYPGANLITGETPFQKEFGSLTSLEKDLLRVAATIYASDIAELRKEEGELYSRSFHLTIPVANYHAFKGISNDLIHALFLLIGCPTVWI